MLAVAGAGAGEQRVGGRHSDSSRKIARERGGGGVRGEELVGQGEAAGQPVHISARLFPIFRPKGTLSSRGAL